MLLFTTPIGDECYATLTHRHNSGERLLRLAVDSTFRKNHRNFRLTSAKRNPHYSSSLLLWRKSAPSGSRTQEPDSSTCQKPTRTHSNLVSPVEKLCIKTFDVTPDSGGGLQSSGDPHKQRPFALSALRTSCCRLARSRAWWKWRCSPPPPVWYRTPKNTASERPPGLSPEQQETEQATTTTRWIGER